MLQVIEDEQLLLHVQQRSAQLMQGLHTLAQAFDCIEEVRGQGLLLGLACRMPVAALIERCREHGLLVLPAGPSVLRLLPALNVAEHEVDEALALLEQSLKEIEE